MPKAKPEYRIDSIPGIPSDHVVIDFSWIEDLVLVAKFDGVSYTNPFQLNILDYLQTLKKRSKLESDLSDLAAEFAANHLNIMFEMHKQAKTGALECDGFSVWVGIRVFRMNTGLHR